MFSSLKRFIGSISVVEKNNIIEIEGLPADFINRDMVKIWGTGRIPANMFLKLGKNKLSFYSFFAPDFVYVLKKLRDDRKARINKRAADNIIAKMMLNTWLKQTLQIPASKLKLEHLDRLTVTLLPHQSEFLQTYDVMTQQYGLNGYLLGAAPGSGKTITALALSLVTEADVFVGVVPKNAVDRVWDATISTMVKGNVKLWTSLSGKPLEKGYTHYIFHYEALKLALDFFSKAQYNNPTVALDECHNFNDLSSQRTVDFILLCKILKSTNILFASGTPIKAMGGEVIPMMRALDPLFIPDVEDRFKKIFGVSVGRGLDILANRMGFMTFKVEKAQVVGNKVEVNRVELNIPNGKDYTLDVIKEQMRVFVEERMAYYQKNMGTFIETYNHCLTLHEKLVKTKAQQEDFALYKKYAKMFHHQALDPMFAPQESLFCNQYEKKNIIPYLPADLKEKFRDAKSVYKYYGLKVQGEALGRILGKQRTQCNVDMVRATEHMRIVGGAKDEESEISLFEIIDDSEKKTVIFTSFVEVVDEMYDYLVENGYQPLRVYGATNKDLPAIVGSFEKNVDFNPLIATFQSLSTAVPLIMANTVVMMNSPFRAHEYEQALSRVDRIGQDEIVRCYNVFLDTGKEPNISTRSNDILKWSRDQVAQIMGMDVADVATLESLEDDAFDENQFIVSIEGCPEIEVIKPAWLSW